VTYPMRFFDPQPHLLFEPTFFWKVAQNLVSPTYLELGLSVVGFLRSGGGVNLRCSMFAVLLNRVDSYRILAKHFQRLIGEILLVQRITDFDGEELKVVFFVLSLHVPIGIDNLTVELQLLGHF
jgi:hypothetical protein